MVRTLLWAARAYERSRREIHQHASAVLYARRGGASASLGPVGGGVPVLGDWRSWPEEDRAEMDDLEGRVRRLYQIAIVKGNSEMVDILLPCVTSLSHRSVPAVPKG